MSPTHTKRTQTAAESPAIPWQERVDAADWDSIGADVDNYGCALTGPLLTPAESAETISLYSDDSRFRSTINMGRYRFGEGEYRYFAEPFPQAVAALKQALYPNLLPIVRDWWTKLGRETPWPDRLDEWLHTCHAAGQTKSTQILLRYGAGDWNALHRDLYGDLVFPLQVVINLNNPGVDHSGGEFLLDEQRPAPNHAGRPLSSPKATDWSSPPATDPSNPNAVGLPHQFVTESPWSDPGSVTRSASSSTTQPDGHPHRPGPTRRSGPAAQPQALHAARRRSPPVSQCGAQPARRAPQNQGLRPAGLPALRCLHARRLPGLETRLRHEGLPVTFSRPTATASPHISDVRLDSYPAATHPPAGHTAAGIDGLVRLAKARRAETATLGCGRYDSCRAAVAAAWTAQGGQILDTVDWAPEAASWLRPARRLTAATTDLWVVCDSPAGWAQVARRLAHSTGWDPARTLGFAGLDTIEIADLARGRLLDGMAGPTITGGWWWFNTGLLLETDDGPIPGIR